MKNQLENYQRFLEKAAKGEDMVVAYLGGSITEGAATNPTQGVGVDGQPYSFTYEAEKQCYRALTYQWMQETFQVREGQFTQINAAIGGTPSFLGAYRLPENVLRHKPDFLFVEFAINDNASPSISDKTPYEMLSIYQTLQSIVCRTQALYPDCAIFLPVSAYRKLGGAQEGWEHALEQGLRVTENYARLAQIPYVRCSDLYYNDPAVEAEKTFMGDSNAGNTVHPSPYGHSVYAKGIIKTLDNIFQTGTFDFPPAQFENAVPVDVNLLKGKPARANMILAKDLQAEGFILENTAYTGFRKQYKKLVSRDTGRSFRYTFQGAAAGMWLEGSTKGYFDVKIDGESVGKWGYNVARSNVNFFSSFSFFLINKELAPEKEHVLELIPDADQSDIKEGGTYSMEILAILIDG